MKNYSEDARQETIWILPGWPGLLGFRWISNWNLTISDRQLWIFSWQITDFRAGFLAAVSCGRAPTAWLDVGKVNGEVVGELVLCAERRLEEKLASCGGGAGAEGGDLGALLLRVEAQEKAGGAPVGIPQRGGVPRGGRQGRLQAGRPLAGWRLP